MRKRILAVAFFGVVSLQPARAKTELRAFHVNIVNLAPDQGRTLTTDRAERFVAILNDGFRTRDGKPIFQFTLKSFHRVDELDLSDCEELVALGDQAVKPTKDEVYAAFDACRDARVADHGAINAYLFNSTFDNGEGKSSRIYFHDFEPFVFMNVDRLDNDWRMWEHEFGHVFGMPELPACGSTPDTDTNVMSHRSDLCEGTGGNRRLNFDPWQVAAMQATAALIARRHGRASHAEP